MRTNRLPKQAKLVYESTIPATNEKATHSGGFRIENRWIFAYGEYLSACHRFASERLLCAEDAHQPAYKAELVYESTIPATNEKAIHSGGFRIENRWIFAYGEYSSPCRRLASGRRSAAGMRTNRLQKQAKLVYESTDLCQHKGHPRGVPFVLAGIVGLEPTKWRSQSPLPYRLAISQYDTLWKDFHFHGFVL